MRRFLPLALCLTFMSAAPYCSGETLTVVDTSGVVRAEQEIDAAGGSVQFSLNDDKGNAADGATVLLKNQTTGEVLTQVSQGGTVVFEAVGPGTWVVSTTTANITFAAVNIAPAVLAGELGGLGLSSTAVAVGGITAVTGATIAIAASNDGSGDVMSPST